VFVCGLDSGRPPRHDQRMTSRQGPLPPARWLAIGLAGVVLGFVAFGASVPLRMLEFTGWPWNASVTEQVGAQSRAEIVHEDGHVETFTGTSAEVGAWMARREAELKDEHGLTRKIAVGRALSVVGPALAAAGAMVLMWRLIVRLRRTTTRPGRSGASRGGGGSAPLLGQGGQDAGVLGRSAYRDPHGPALESG
jgi:hypothetical protein